MLEERSEFGAAAVGVDAVVENLKGWVRLGKAVSHTCPIAFRIQGSILRPPALYLVLGLLVEDFLN